MTKRLAARHRRSVVNNDGHIIGLDLGATAVRAVVLEPGRLDGHPVVTMHSVATQTLPSGVVVNGVVQDPETLTAALKQLWASHKMPCNRVILGVANSQVLVRDMTIPDLDPDQRAKALPFQAREIIALPIDQVVLDFCPLGQPDPGTGMVQGLLMASPREPVLTAVRAVERAGLTVARVDLASLGALRSIADARPTVGAIVDLGAHLSTILVHDHGVPKLVRTLARGGQSLTVQLAERLSIGELEAEYAKRESGLEAHGSEVARLLEEALRPLVAEVRTSIQYFRVSNPGTQLDQLSLTGGGASLKGIAERLQEQIGLPTRVVDPLQHVRPDARARGNRPSVLFDALRQEAEDTSLERPSAVSVGLAMGRAA